MIARISFVLTLVVFGSIANIYPQTVAPVVWQETDKINLSGLATEEKMPLFYRAFSFDRLAAKEILDSAPLEFTEEAKQKEIILYLPDPAGNFEKFSIQNSPLLSSDLAEKYPSITTYSGQGIDDSSATMRITFGPSGLYAIVIKNEGSYLVSPRSDKDDSFYISYFTKSADETRYECETSASGIAGLGKPEFPAYSNPSGDSFVISGNTLRTYRFSFAVTQQFYQRFGGPVISQQNDVGVTTALTAYISNFTVIYEREFATRFMFQSWIADRPGYCFEFSNCFPPSQTPIQMLQPNQFLLDNVWPGAGNYDIGTALGYDNSQPLPSGYASFGSGNIGGACEPQYKGQSATRLTGTAGDYLGTTILSHEFGHMYGAKHTFSSTQSACGSGIDTTNMFEPGSGSTLMGYAPACGSDNLTSAADPVFHIDSLLRIANHKSFYSACGQTTSNGNSPPVITNGAANATIPAFTPFVLTAAATDANGDLLYYSWEEWDPGTRLFRSYIPLTTPSRTFPNLDYVRFNGNVPPPTNNGFLTGELLPSTTRQLNFTVTVRDNRNGGGGTTARDTLLTINVVGTAGPFAVTQPNSNVVWGALSQQTVTWNEAGTNLPNIGTANVRILLSTDNGLTFPTVLAASTQNDGIQVVTMPNILTTSARIKIEALGNIYFDMSNTSFTLVAGTPTPTNTPTATPTSTPTSTPTNTPTATPTPVNKGRFDYDGDRKTDVSVFRPSNGIWFLRRSQAGDTAVQFGLSTDKIAPADYDNDGKTDIAVYRQSQGVWHIFNSSSQTASVTQFGISEDLPTPGDYDNDGRADLAIYRPSTKTWWLNRTTEGLVAIQFGLTGDIPVPGDFDGDRRSDLVVWRPSNGVWYMQRSTAGGFAIQFGTSTDKIAPADFDGDGKMDVAVYRPSQGTWYIVNSSNGGYPVEVFGLPTDIPTPGDYDGDGRADIAIFRPSNGQWWINRTTSGLIVTQFGTNGDTPTPNAFGN